MTHFFRVIIAALALHLCLPDLARSQTSRPSASMRIYPAQRAKEAIPRYLTGKFCEHLRSNILNGMDAQILRNATFADFPFAADGLAPDGGAKMEIDDEKIDRELKSMAKTSGWPDSELAALVSARKEGLASFWRRVGPPGDCITSPDTGPYGGRAQRIEGRAGESVGIAQWTYLPLHRTRRYEVEIYARSANYTSNRAGTLLDVQVTIQAANGKEAATAQLGSTSEDWQRLTARLELPPDAAADEPWRFTVGVHAAVVIQRIRLLPADHVNGADPDVVRLLKESRLPILRWPGGNFASGYHWRDGVGPLEQRPTTPNASWGGVEPNHFGTDEFIAFCTAVGCEPMICINAGDGTPQEAAQWLEYCNGPADSPMGKLRAANGHPAPYEVSHWEIGNELWGRWQSRWTTPHGYIDRYFQFSAALKQTGQRLHLYACGAPPKWDDRWNEELTSLLAHNIQCFADHPLIGGPVGADLDPLDVYRDFMAVPRTLERRWQGIQERLERVGCDPPRIAVTELQMFAHLAPAKPSTVRRLSRDYLVWPLTMAEAMYDILLYHAAVRLAPLIEVITHSATVNHGGGLRKLRERVYATPCHYAQGAFTALAGATPVKLEVQSARQRAPRVLPGLRDLVSEATFDAVDAVAAVTEHDLWLSIVHCGTGEAIDLEINLAEKGFGAGGTARVWTLSAEVPWAQNSSETPEAIHPVEASASIRAGTLRLTVPPYAVVRVQIPAD